MDTGHCVIRLGPCGLSDSKALWEKLWNNQMEKVKKSKTAFVCSDTLSGHIAPLDLFEEEGKSLESYKRG